MREKLDAVRFRSLQDIRDFSGELQLGEAPMWMLRHALQLCQDEVERVTNKLARLEADHAKELAEMQQDVDRLLDERGDAIEAKNDGVIDFEQRAVAACSESMSNTKVEKWVIIAKAMERAAIDYAAAMPMGTAE